MQVVIALIVTPEGYPLAYEVLPGNTADKTTLKDFLAEIEDQYGKAERVWVMDRGIPTEEVLEQMRGSTPPVNYLVGTPKGRLTALEQPLLTREWQQARPSVRVKLLPHDGETYVLAESQDRVKKERSMRQLRLRVYLKTLKNITQRKTLMKRDDLHQAIGAAEKEAGRDARFVKLTIQHHHRSTGQGKKAKREEVASLSDELDGKKLREAWRREGRYLLRTNMSHEEPSKLWEYYLQLTEVEQAFKELKHDLAVRPIHHQLDHRIEAHIFICCFAPPHGAHLSLRYGQPMGWLSSSAQLLAYALQVTLKTRLKRSAKGLTPRSALEKFATLQMLVVHLPTSDGREIIMARYTHPEKDPQLILDQLKLTLPEQAPPRITGAKNDGLSGQGESSL